jgi:hypothetical protein
MLTSNDLDEVTIGILAMPATMEESSYAVINVRHLFTCNASKYNHILNISLDEQFSVFMTIMLYCSNPPLELSDIPNGEWICHACHCALKKENTAGNKRKKKSALEVLAFAASLVNPREFNLPRELQLPITFPGTDKIDPVSYKRGKHHNSTNVNG